MKKKSKKPIKRNDGGELSLEDWARLNKEYFGEDNAGGWLPDKNDDEDSDETEEISFDKYE